MSSTVVMIADGRPFFRAGVRQALTPKDGAGGLDVLECDTGENGDEALARIAADAPDVVLLDIGYPLLNGLQLCRSIVRTLPLTKVVMLSTNPQDDGNELFEAIRTGAAAYIRSSEYSPELLIETMHRASGGEYPINDSLSSKPEVARRVLRRFQDMSSGVREEDDLASPLTARETEILNHVAEGNGNKLIAGILGISEQSIKNHVSSILRKLHANDRAHAVMLAVRGGWVRAATERSLSRRRGDTLAEAEMPPKTHSN